MKRSTCALALFAVAFLSLATARPALSQTGPRVAHQPSARAPLSAAIQTGDIFGLSDKLGATAETREMTTDPPARVTVAVSGLVGGAAIEIAFVAVRD